MPDGTPASATGPATWSSFEEVVAAYEAGGFDGIGFVFSKNDPYGGIDLDDCRDPATGDIAPWAQEIIDKFASYSEVSPSGTGVHILRPRQRYRRAASGKRIELYSSERYFTVTGWWVEGTPPTVEEAQKKFTALWEELTKEQRALAVRPSRSRSTISTGTKTRRASGTRSRSCWRRISSSGAPCEEQLGAGSIPA